MAGLVPCVNYSTRPVITTYQRPMKLSPRLRAKLYRAESNAMASADMTLRLRISGIGILFDGE